MIKWYDIRIWKWVMVVTVVMIAIFTMTGCRSKEYVMVPEYHTEYVYRADTVAKADSVYAKDSVYVYRNGDTVMIQKIAYRDRWHNVYKVKMDTIIKRDSVSVPYPVERELTKNEKRLLSAVDFFRGFLVCGLVVMLIFWYRNKKC